MNLDGYQEIWFIDFEYQAEDGERPVVNCMVAHELRTGQTLRYFTEELRGCRVPPFNTGPDSLVVAFFASAEMGCFLALGWAFPPDPLTLLGGYCPLTTPVAASFAPASLRSAGAKAGCEDSQSVIQDSQSGRGEGGGQGDRRWRRWSGQPGKRRRQGP